MKALARKQKQLERTTLWIGVISSVLLVGTLCIVAGATLCHEEGSTAEMAGLMGAPKDVGQSNSGELDDIGQFAVNQYNTKEGKNLSFKKVVSAKKQVVSGTMYHLVIEAHGDEAVKNYAVKVWHKPWENHKSLEDFKPHDGTANFSTHSEAAGMQSVSVEDPVIKEAADHALKGLNDRSNSLVQYELRQVVSAHAEATDEHTNFDLHLKVARGSKEEELKAELHRTAEGRWTVKHAGPI